MAEHTVLVYGTLRTGKHPTVEVEAEMYDLGWFPGIRLGGGEKITCERITGVDDDKLAQFDRYEGYREDDPSSSLYIRRRLDNGDFIYEYNCEIDEKRHKHIESGDWFEHTGDTAGSNAKLTEVA